MAKQCIMFQENIEKRYKVSVAMAVYNGEHYLAEQLDSILCQLRYDDELWTLLKMEQWISWKDTLL